MPDQFDSASGSDLLAAGHERAKSVPVVIIEDRSVGQNALEEDEIDTSRLFTYLQSAQGHEIAKSVVEIVQDIKKAALNQNTSQARLEKYLQLGIVLTVITAASVLAGIGKLDSTISVLFGTMLGYVFGRKA